MAWTSVNYKSRVLKMPIELEIIAPQYDSVSNSKNKVLILLHGAIGDRTSWLLRSQIAFFASKKNICVVMPSVKNYCYVNTANGYRYMDFICEELPCFIKNMFAVSDEREDWMIAGCSMGGYGAIRCGLNKAELFGYIGSFSGALDMVKVYSESKYINMENVFGSKEELADSDNNLMKLMVDAYKCLGENDCNLPKILLTCGEQDDLYESNVNFYNNFGKMCDMNFLHKKGEHDWDIWNDSINCAMEWFYGSDNYKEVF